MYKEPTKKFSMQTPENGEFWENRKLKNLMKKLVNLTKLVNLSYDLYQNKIYIKYKIKFYNSSII